MLHLYIAVQNVQDTLAYTIPEFFVTLRNDSLTQFGFGLLQYFREYIISSHTLYHPLSSGLRGEVYHTGICWFETSDRLRTLFQIEEEVAVGFLCRVHVSVI